MTPSATALSCSFDLPPPVPLIWADDIDNYDDFELPDSNADDVAASIRSSNQSTKSIGSLFGRFGQFLRRRAGSVSY
ncbi:hypothetical protein HDU79_000478 [Rhizoclosmatium sp. JEL0117]|nr:hypothetical protein HDU79_000478 [Rhizoclosmatium sp. JEL0117]